MIAFPRSSALLLAGVLLALALSACGDTGGDATVNTQGGTGRAPGAPPSAQQTARPTATTAR